MVLTMRSLLKHFLLIALLVFHSSWGVVMAAQMQTSQLKMGTPDSSIPEVATLDRIASKPCPHHLKSKVENKVASPTQAKYSMADCIGHDCSNCNCVNVVSSIPSLTASFDYIQIDRSNVVSFIASVFPDSPPNFILRPPIS